MAYIVDSYIKVNFILFEIFLEILGEEEVKLMNDGDKDTVLNVSERQNKKEEDNYLNEDNVHLLV